MIRRFVSWQGTNQKGTGATCRFAPRPCGGRGVCSSEIALGALTEGLPLLRIEESRGPHPAPRGGPVPVSFRSALSDRGRSLVSRIHYPASPYAARSENPGHPYRAPGVAGPRLASESLWFRALWIKANPAQCKTFLASVHRPLLFGVIR